MSKPTPSAYPSPAQGASVEALAPPEPRRWSLLAGLGLLAAGVWLGSQWQGREPTPAGVAPPQTVAQLSILAPPPPPVALPPSNVTPSQGQGPRIEVAFVLDTTGSMAGLLRAARSKVWSIVNELADAQPRPEIALGLVAYRDHGDRYVTQTVPLTTDLDAFYEALQGLKARGGGDIPEAVEAGLQAALEGLGWTRDGVSLNPWTGIDAPTQAGSSGRRSARLAFLMGDAPAHEPKLCLSLADRFAASGIRLNTVQIGERDLETWQIVAQNAAGTFFQLDQRPQTVSVEAPQDGAIAAIQRRIEATVLPYGQQAQQESTQRQWSMNRSLDRETYSSRACAQSKTGSFYAGDLIQALESGAIASLGQLDPALLPTELQALKPAAREGWLAAKRSERQELRDELTALVAARDVFLRSTAARARDTFDRKVLDCLRHQLEAGGLTFPVVFQSR